MAGHGENWDRARCIVLPERATELEPVHSGYGKIGQHDVGTAFLRFRQRLMTVMSLGNSESGVDEKHAVHLTRTQIVLDNQDEWRLRRRRKGNTHARVSLRRLIALDPG